MVTINFENTYDLINIESDLSKATFNSPQLNGTDQILVVIISPHPDKYLPNVYNLGFGPPDEKGGFLDNVSFKHTDSDRVFSTVLFLGLIFLKENPERVIGIDGSDDVRATLYHLMYKRNKEYLIEFFNAIGVD